MYSDMGIGPEVAFAVKNLAASTYMEYITPRLDTVLKKIPEDMHDKIIDCFKSFFLDETDYKKVMNVVRFLLEGEGKRTLDGSTNERFTYRECLPPHVDCKVAVRLLRRIANVSKKGVGKGEILCHLLFAGTSKSESRKEDIRVQMPNGFRTIEVKAENASYKNTKDSSFRAIDAARKKLFAGTEDQFSSNDAQNVKLFLETVYKDFNTETLDKLVHLWDSTTSLEAALREEIRKTALCAEVKLNYQKIDGHDAVLAVSLKEDDIAFIFMPMSKDIKFLYENFSLKPQTLRGRGTQAIGDGYIDAEPRTPKQVLKAQKQYQKMEKYLNVTV